MSGWRGVGAELNALHEEMHVERVRAYDRELVLWSELARLREAWKAAAERRPMVSPERAHALAGLEDGARVTEGFQLSEVEFFEVSPGFVAKLAALPDDQVAKLHGLGPKGAMR